MSGGWQVLDGNLVTWVLVVVVAFSLVQGFRRGASGSVRQLLYFLVSSIVTLLAIIISAMAAWILSPHVQNYLRDLEVSRPDIDASFFAQIGYTALSGLRDLPLLRFAILFLVLHIVIRLLLGLVFRFVVGIVSTPLSAAPNGGAVSRSVGSMIGAALGTGRALLITAVLFAYCAMLPQGPFTDYIQQSGLYREVASQVIRPATGNLIDEQLPVFAQAMSSELDQLWQKRYDIIDAELPDSIVQAAVIVTEGKASDEDKARALYDWVGTRIIYDDDKVKAYEDQGDWREQDPEHTFTTRRGVCIDYARLYASMARAVHLEVRVVTGLGYDGRGGFGAHAWNEVYLSEQARWVPLDATWAMTGNWFDSPGFADTHIKQGGLIA